MVERIRTEEGVRRKEMIVAKGKETKDGRKKEKPEEREKDTWKDKRKK